eukprot:147232_1
MPSSSTKEGLKPKPYADQDNNEKQPKRSQQQDQLNRYKARASMLESDNKRIQKINKQLQRKNSKMDEEAKKMEQEIQYLKKIHTKLDSLKQLQEKHTEAMRAKEEKITRLQSSYDQAEEDMRGAALIKMNQFCTETMTRYRNENENKIQNANTKIE